jgi:hypothetical protein
MKTYIIFFFLVLIGIVSICGDRYAEYDLVMGCSQLNVEQTEIQPDRTVFPSLTATPALRLVRGRQAGKLETTLGHLCTRFTGKNSEGCEE